MGVEFEFGFEFEIEISRLSFRIGRVGTQGEGWEPWGGCLDYYHPVYAMFPSAHLDTPQGWDFSDSSAHNVPWCTPRNTSGLGQQHWWDTSQLVHH